MDWTGRLGRWRATSLHHKILLIFGFGLVVPSLAITWLSYRTSVGIINRLVTKQQEEVLLAISREIWLLQDQSRTQLLTLGNSLPVTRALRRGEEPPAALVEAFARLNPHWKDLAFYDGRGRFLGSSAKTQTTSFDPFFLEAFANRFVQTPVVGTSMQYRTRMGLSLMEEGELAGVIAGSLDLSVIDRKLRLRGEGEATKALIWDDRGVVFGSGLPEDELKDLLQALDLVAVARELLSPGSESIHRRVDLPGGSILFSATSLPEFISRWDPIPGEHWFVALAQPYSSAVQELWAFQSRLLVFLLLLFGALAAVLWWMGQRITGPLEQMAGFAADVAGGKRDLRLESQRRDELGILSDALDSMTGALQKYEQDLVRAEVLASLGRMSSVMAHEIRNPLNTIRGASQLLQLRFPDDPSINEYAVMIELKVQRLSNLVDHLLRLARLPAPEIALVHLEKLAMETLEPYRPRLEDQRVKVEHTGVEGKVIRYDETQLTEIVQNVLQNSLDVMPDRGVFSISAVEFPEAFEVTFSDSGPGVPGPMRERLFTPFASGKRTGTGLGLVLCRMIAENHGGSFEFRPTEQGACFVLRIPK